jgi:outer membrane protein OmpA-like peptidoglycan-associated protein
VNRWPRVVGGLAVGGLVPVLLASAALAMVRQEPGEPRVRDLQYRVRDLTYRVNTLDNAERVAETPEEISVTLAADVLFEFDRADLTPVAVTRLEDLAGQLDDRGPRTVTIGGHTDRATARSRTTRTCRSAVPTRCGLSWTSCWTTTSPSR